MAAVITLSAGTIDSTGKSITWTISGGTGSGYAITNSAGLIINSSIGTGALRRLITGQSVSGTTLTITLGFPIGSGATGNTISTNSGATSTLSDDGGNTLTTVTNASIPTNSSSVSVSSFSSSNAAFRFQGAFTTTVSGGRDLYSPQPAPSGFAVGFTGTDVALVMQSNTANDVSLDGAAATSITPSTVNVLALLPIITATTEATHDLLVTKGQYWDAGTGSTSNGTILVAGASPAVSAPSGYWGTRYFVSDAPFTTYAEFNPAPLFTNSASLAGKTYKKLQSGGESLRFNSDSTFIGLWAFRATSGDRTYIVYQDGVQIASYTVPTTPSSTYQRHILASGLSGSHNYEILCSFPLNYKTTAIWYEGYLELDGSGILSVSNATRLIHAWYGDSIVGMGSGTPSFTDVRNGDNWQAARANGAVGIPNGVGGGKVHTTGRDGTANIPTNCDILHIQYGYNDTTGTPTSQANFEASYATMLTNARTRIGSGKRIICYRPLPATSVADATLDTYGGYIQNAITASGVSDVTYIPTAGWVPRNTTYLPDGTHPNALGYTVLANRKIPISAPFAISVSGPSSGASGSPSTTFTVTLAGGATFTGDQVVTLTASDGTIDVTVTGSVADDNTISPDVTPNDGQTSFSFTYTPASAGSKTITPTSAQAGWTMPAASGYTAASSTASYQMLLVA